MKRHGDPQFIMCEVKKTPVGKKPEPVSFWVHENKVEGLIVNSSLVLWSFTKLFVEIRIERVIVFTVQVIQDKA